MSSEESNKMSKQTPLQDLPFDPRNEEDYDTWEYGTEPLPGDGEWANKFLDEVGQFENPMAEMLWENEKKKARRMEVDKGQDFIESGMTLITEPESDKYLKSVTPRTEEN
jgi:hypothetical protein